MHGTTRSSARLPRRVYWFRRTMVLVVLVSLGVGIGRLLFWGSNAVDETEAVVLADSATEVDTPAALGTPYSGVEEELQVGQAGPSSTPARPSGKCLDSDVVVSPDISDARAGGDVAITLQFSTKTAQACRFEVSPDSVVLKLASGDETIWTSQQCRRAVPTTTVIASKSAPGTLAMTWPGYRSNEECSRTASWVLPGPYRVEAAALGGEPTVAEFTLNLPEQETITPKPTAPERSDR